jgi:8-oxo-dGTP pyrophosphatase MutT (NUDIX family)
MPEMTIAWVRERLARHSSRRIDGEVAPRRAAVAIILHQEAPGDLEPRARDGCSILFIHRSPHPQDPWSGHMAFPGGRVDPGDASPLHAARRETLEEVGIDLERDAELLGQLDDQRASARGAVLPMAISPFVFHLMRPAALHPNDEVAEALWIPVRHLLDPSSAGTVPYELDGVRFQLPSLNYSRHVIWGLTYQMLMRLFTVLDWLT